jgi:hypothetical protein
MQAQGTTPAQMGVLGGAIPWVAEMHPSANVYRCCKPINGILTMKSITIEVDMNVKLSQKGWVVIPAAL